MNRRQVSYQEGEALAKENNMLFLETSAKLAKNVEQVRDFLWRIRIFTDKGFSWNRRYDIE